MSDPWCVRIAGLGRHLPARVVDTVDLAAERGWSARFIVRRVGVRSRRWAGDDDTNASMGAAAAREALDEAGIAAQDVELVVNASGTPEQAIPDGGALLQRALGLGDSGIPALTVHATCLSFLAALDLCAPLVASGRYRRVLVVSSEIASVGLDPCDPETGSLFGDAAAAAVIERSPEGDPARIEALRLETYGDGASLTAIPGGGTRRHPMRAGVQREESCFVMDGPAVLRASVRRAPAFLERLRPGLSAGLGDIDVVVPHQPSAAGLSALRTFGWADDRVVSTLASLGNCVAASLPCTLYEAARSGRLRRGQRVLLVGTGAGLSFGGAVLVF